jgi:tRNA-splicing ligase RtcB
LDSKTDAGRAYLSNVDCCLRYAAASRMQMLLVAAALVQTRLGYAIHKDSLVDCHHNHVRREEVAGVNLWVHRKGAIPARQGESGIIPGSMGTATFHVTGRGVAAALMSSSHGAGRCMSRGEARRQISERQLARQMADVGYDSGHGRSLVEEAPRAYKDIHRVMRAQRELTRVVRRFRPVLVYKGTRKGNPG